MLARANEHRKEASAAATTAQHAPVSRPLCIQSLEFPVSDLSPHAAWGTDCLAYAFKPLNGSNCFRSSQLLPS